MTGKTPETHRNGPRSDEQGEVDPNCVSEIRGPQNGAQDCAACSEVGTPSMADVLRYWLAGRYRENREGDAR